MKVAFSKSDRYKAAYPDVAFGWVLVSGCENPENPEGFDSYKRKLLRKMRKRETLAGIRERIETYEKFFNDFGRPCPLPGHLKRTVDSGFPRYNLAVDSHFLAEMCAGILVAVTDFDKIEGPLLLDLADEGETCLGMGGRELQCRAGEVVLRDSRDIICVLCQGADEKTRVTDKSRNILFYSYAVPGIGPAYLEQGLSTAADAVTRFGGGSSGPVAVV